MLCVYCAFKVVQFVFTACELIPHLVYYGKCFVFAADRLYGILILGSLLLSVLCF